MRPDRSTLLLSGVLLLASCGGGGEAPMASDKGTPPPVIPMEDFFKNPEQVSFRISPDGSHISYRAPWKDRMNIYVKDLASGEVTQVTHDTVRDVGGYFWKGDRIIYSRDVNGNENFIVFSAATDGSDVKALTPEADVRAGTLDDLHGVEGMERHIIVQMNERNPEVFDPWLVNIETGERRQLVDNSENYQSWITDHDGVIRIATRTDGVSTTLFHRASADAPFEAFKTVSFKDEFSPLFFTFDNKNLFVSTNLGGRDKAAVVEYDLAGDTELREIYANPDYDVQGLDYSRKRQVLTMAYYTGWKQERVFLDDKTEAMYAKMAPRFEDKEFWIYGEDDDETKFMVWAGDDRDPGKYYFYDAVADDVQEVATPYPWLDPTQLAEMRPIQYTSRDGLTIHGYLTLPQGREPKALPVVVNPHGGPWARDNWGYNPEVQMLANRGYAVLQMNFRGSTGYGRTFWEASFKQWGRAMQDDITDGVDWLIEQGIADPDRIAIYGGSYGGYATLAGITFTPELYACAVDYVGVSNLFTFMRTIPPYWKPYLDMMHEMVGDPATDSVMMAAASPVYHVDKIQVPLFIAQGANDPRVVKAESDQVVEALKQRGVEVQYLVKDDEGHGFRKEENRFDFYGAMESFLDEHIGSGYQPAQASGDTETATEG